MRQIDWEERCWQLSHDVAVRLAIEAKDNGDNPVDLAGEAVQVAVATCDVYRRALAIVQQKAGGQA